MDTFRKTCPKRRLYTFSQSGGNAKSRIDRIYVSSSMIGKAQKVIFENRQESDHKLVRVKIAKDIDIGSGTWIFNNTLLGNEVYTNEIRKIIRTYKNENKKINFPDNRVSWEFFNMETKNFSQQFSKKLARERRRQIEIVRNKLEILESIPKENINTDIKNEVNRLKKIEREYNEKLEKKKG